LEKSPEFVQGFFYFHDHDFFFYHHFEASPYQDDFSKIKVERL